MWLCQDVVVPKDKHIKISGNSAVGTSDNVILVSHVSNTFGVVLCGNTAGPHAAKEMDIFIEKSIAASLLFEQASLRL